MDGNIPRLFFIRHVHSHTILAAEIPSTNPIKNELILVATIIDIFDAETVDTSGQKNLRSCSMTAITLTILAQINAKKAIQYLSILTHAV